MSRKVHVEIEASIRIPVKLWLTVNADDDAALRAEIVKWLYKRKHDKITVEDADCELKDIPDQDLVEFVRSNLPRLHNITVTDSR